MTDSEAIAALVAWTKEQHQRGSTRAHWTMAYHEKFMVVLWRDLDRAFIYSKRYETFNEAAGDALMRWEKRAAASADG